MRIGILAERGLPETQGLVNAVVEAGHKPHVIHYPGLAVMTGGEGGISIVGDSEAEKVDYVVPYHDRYMLSGNRVLAALIQMGIPSSLDPEKALTARNKHLAQLAFTKAGIRHPRSVAVPMELSPDPLNRAWDLDALMDKVESDEDNKLVVKALYGTQGEEVWLKDRQGAREKADELNAQKLEFMFQQALPLMPGETQASDKGVLVCGGRVIAAFQRFAKDGDFRANIAQGAEGYDYQPSPEEEAMALTASKRLGICFGRLDIMDSLQGPQAIEFNVFPGHQIVDITGVNVPKFYIEHALQNYEHARENVPSSETSLYPTGDASSASDGEGDQ